MLLHQSRAANKRPARHRQTTAAATPLQRRALAIDDPENDRLGHRRTRSVIHAGRIGGAQERCDCGNELVRFLDWRKMTASPNALQPRLRNSRVKRARHRHRCDRVVFQHFDKAGDAIVDQWLIGACEAKKVYRDYAMRSGKAVQAESPLIGIASQRGIEQFIRIDGASENESSLTRQNVPNLVLFVTHPECQRSPGPSDASIPIKPIRWCGR